MVKLVLDSSADGRAPEGVLFQSVPLTISTDEHSFRDDGALDIGDMLSHLGRHSGRSYTACPSVDDWIQAFAGADVVFAVTITSSLSGCYNAAMAAQRLYAQTHPEVFVHVFDSLSTGPEMALLAEKLAELARKGLSPEEIVREAEAYLQSTRLFFVLQSLHNLAVNGRVSKLVAAAVGVLGIRILATASSEGTIAPISKCRGDRKAIPELLEQLEHAGYHGGKLRVSHVQNQALAETLAQKVHEKWPEADIQIYPAGGLCSYYAEIGGILVGMES